MLEEVPGETQEEMQPADGFALDGGSEAESEGNLLWRPGESAAPHVARKVGALRQQAQVLVTNAYLNMRKLDKNLLRSICNSLPPISTTAKVLAARATAHILRLSANTIRGCVRRVSQNRWTTYDVAGTEAELRTAVSSVSAQKREAPQVILERLVREAVHNIARSRTDEEFVLSVAKLQKHGLDCGDKFVSKEFLQTVEFVGAKFLQVLQMEQLCKRLPGVGTLAPIAVAFDGVSVGDTFFSRSETFEVIMMSSISPVTGMLTEHFVSSPSVGC